MEVTREVRDQILDEEHLRLLSIGFYVTGGCHFAFASLFIFHFIMLLTFGSHPEAFAGVEGSTTPDGFLHGFAAMIGVLIVLGWSFGIATMYAGRCIQRRTGRLFSMILGGLNVVIIPHGTVVGVTTFMVLTRPSVSRLYGE